MSDLKLLLKITVCVCAPIAWIWLVVAELNAPRMAVFFGLVFAYLLPMALFRELQPRLDWWKAIGVAFAAFVVLMLLMQISAATWKSTGQALLGLVCFAAFVAGVVYYFEWMAKCERDALDEHLYFQNRSFNSEKFRHNQHYEIDASNVVIEEEASIVVEMPIVQKRIAWSIKVRRKIWEDHRKRCYYCDCELEDWRGVNMHLDHKHPLAKGGTDSEDNLVPACPRCNLEKSDKVFPELL